MKKILITAFFGPLPEWYGKYQPPAGYDFLLLTDLEDFNTRVKDKLGFDSPVVSGGTKTWDMRPALGLLYEKELEGYDFWGTTDLDCVYGDVGKWVTDDFLEDLDLHSNHHSYVSGPWTLYRNNEQMRTHFMLAPDWKDNMSRSDTTAWVERSYSRFVENSGIRYKYTYWQGKDPGDDSDIVQKDGKLYDHGDEIMMFHFNRKKRWPLQENREKDYWNGRYARGYTSGDGSYGKQSTHKIELITRHIPAEEIQTITEVGCGDFNLGKNLLKQYPAAKYTGLDISEVIIERNQLHFPEHTFTVFNGENAHPADMVICVDVLFHILEDADCVKLIDTLKSLWTKYLVVTAYDYSREEKENPNMRVRKFPEELFGTPICREIVEEEGSKYLFIFKK